MKKILTFILFVCLSILVVFNSNISFAETKETDNTVYLGGMVSGFSLKTRGAKINGFSKILTENGQLESPAETIGLKINDIILSIDSYDINDSNEIEQIIKNDEERNIIVSRENFIFNTKIKPIKDIFGKYKLGIYTTDDLYGLGTITYIKNNNFASLGHPVLNDDGKTLEIIGGNLFSANVYNVEKGIRGKAGELKGVIESNNQIGNILENTSTGIYGKINDNLNLNDLIKVEFGTANIGEAYIYTNLIDNTIKKYKIEIIKCDYNEEKLKNFVIKIEDKDLINKTGGIVQGMSGSPIVQNGKLVGAITHVFLNDPTRGFGISINNMNCDMYCKN